MPSLHELLLRTAVDHCLMALRVEGAAPTIIDTYRSVMASHLRWATTTGSPPWPASRCCRCGPTWPT